MKAKQKTSQRIHQGFIIFHDAALGPGRERQREEFLLFKSTCRWGRTMSLDSAIDMWYWKQYCIRLCILKMSGFRKNTIIKSSPIKNSKLPQKAVEEEDMDKRKKQTSEFKKCNLFRVLWSVVEPKFEGPAYWASQPSLWTYPCRPWLWLNCDVSLSIFRTFQIFPWWSVLRIS